MKVIIPKKTKKVVAFINMISYIFASAFIFFNHYLFIVQLGTYNPLPSLYALMRDLSIV